ncbi:SbcC/MukB-like Walker B domain-containing protein [Herminiimonas sp. NPDC097707]|uniref:SbcC/MukB-like Walker B domain-containing protein n=1 Tax=Herminiimonas sp. NPDC097707 TaxID=3364007 RepID=UPI00383A0010
MKQLESVKLVQFYLYEHEDVRFERHTGIFGQNGSGKSTLLDAIQAAIMGGNTNLISLNAQADEKHMTRSLRAYCLGQYGDMPEDRVRDVATTYISLIWRDTETGAPVTTGICIEASSDQEKHAIVGRYVLRDVELSMGDHLQIIDGKPHPRDWSVFRQALLERSRVSGENPVFPDSEKYIRQMLLALRGSGGLPSMDAFTRALRFGLRMSFKKTVDEIVRYDVLESRPTKITQFKEVTESFRRLSALVAEVEAKINDGEKVIEEFDKATSDGNKFVTWIALTADAGMELANEFKEKAASDRGMKEDLSVAKSTALERARAEVNAWNDKVGNIRSLRDSHAAHQDYGALSREIDSAKRAHQGQVVELTTQLNAIRSLVRRSVQSGQLTSFANEFHQVDAKVSSLLESAFPTMEDLSTNLPPALELLGRCGEHLFTSNRQLQNESDELARQIAALKEDMSRASTGKAPLNEAVKELLRHLRNHSLSPTPVCDLVRVKDPAWQPVIEAYLASNREALLVRGAEESEAFDLYRQTRNLYGVKLARESSQNLDFRPVVGSVAALIDGDDPAAVAYLRVKLGDLKCAETNAEALAGGRTLTKDGMLVSKGEIDRIKPLRSHEFKIGITADVQTGHLQRELERLLQVKQTMEETLGVFDALLKDLIGFGGKKQRFEQIIGVHDRALQQAKIQTSLEAKLAESASEEYVELGKQLADAEKQVEKARSAAESLAIEVGIVNNDVESAKRREAAAVAEAVTAADTSRAARSQDGFLAQFASENWDKLLERCGQNFTEMREHSRERAVASARLRDAAAQRGLNALVSFTHNHREQVGRELAEDWVRASTWIRELVARLKSTDLVEQKERMEEAYRTSQETFRTDVAIALNNNIEWLDQSMNRLNKALRQCPAFSNGERYQFSRNIRPQLKHLLNFIQDVASHGAVEDLLGGAGEIPPEFKELLEEKVAPGAAGNKSALDDYREFFEFEIEILREDSETGKSKAVGKLSKRLGSGSGGEHRAPLYVIAGAALASAYRLDDGHRDGMGLILLDEAFNKMDITNIMATMRYLEDLGLQVVLASPGENLGILTAYLHRYYEILRDPVANVVDLEGRSVSEETRLAYRKDLPEFNPELIEAELRVIELVKAPAGEFSVTGG